MSLIGLTLRRSFLTNVRLNSEIGHGSATAGGHGGGYILWRKLTYFVAIPSCILCTIHCYLEHHKSHNPREEFKAYEHLRIRTRKFPWGDGNHSFCHNPLKNALPDGYEVEEETHH